jgi:hypothetical protein
MRTKFTSRSPVGLTSAACLGVAATAVALSVVVFPSAARADTGGPRLVYSDGGRAYRATAAHPTHRHALAKPRHSSVWGVAVSPNGRRVAEYVFVRLHCTTRGCRGFEMRLVVGDKNGQHRHQVFVNHSSGFFLTGLAWSPNSKRLYYGTLHNEQCGVPSASHLVMARIHADGTVERSRVPGGDGLTSPTVSPGGGRLAAVRTTYDDQCFARSSSLVKLRLRDGHVSAPLLTATDTQFALSRPAWSPDDARIAVVAQNPCCTGAGESSNIDVVAADGSSHGIPVVAASGNSNFWLGGAAWRSTSQLWYSRAFVSEDDHTPSQPGNLYSVRLSETGVSFEPPVKRTGTPRRSEGGPSFGLRS